MDELINGEEICCQDGVLLKIAKANNITELDNSGTLCLMKYENDNYYIEWKPNESFLIADFSDEQDWSIVNTIAKRNRTESETLIFNTSTSTVSPIKDLAPNACNKNQGNSSSLSQQQKSKTIRAKIKDLKMIEILPNGTEIRLINKCDGKIHSQYFFQQRNADNFIRNLLPIKLVKQNSKYKRIYEINDFITNEENNLSTFERLNIGDIKNSKGASTGVINDFFVKFAEMIPPISNAVSQSSEEQDSNIQHNTSGEEYEVLSSYANPFEIEIKELEDKLPKRRNIARGPYLNEKTWKEFQSEDGRISDVEKVKEIIFRGGMQNNLRREVWKYLLDYSPWEMTRDQITDYHRERTAEYFQMKLQWKSMTKIQEEHFAGYRDRKCQIEKDVKRTDRTEEFFAGDDNPNLDLLQDILMTYVMYNFDLGYVQGMSDLLAPILFVMKNEQDSFWCFVGFMKRVFSNFDIDQAGMKKQLHQLSRLLSFTCPRLYYYFKDTSSDNMYFCFRWLLVWFKREFSHADVMELWEVMWTGLPCENFHLFVCVAILELQMDTFIDNKYEFTDILKHINDLSLKLNLKLCLENAEAVYHQIKESPHITDELRIIIGEEPLENQDDDSDLENRIVDNNTEEASTETIEDDQKLEELCELSMHYSFL